MTDFMVDGDKTELEDQIAQLTKENEVLKMGNTNKMQADILEL